MLRTWQFYVLWFMYACGAGAGLMIISKLAKIALDQAGLSLGFVLVAVLAVGNGAGRIGGPGRSRTGIGRRTTLFICFAAQAVLIIVLSLTSEGGFLARPVVLALLSALIGANYGANLALFPSITKDYYGLKNFGVNYGLVFTAWGLGGFMLALLAGEGLRSDTGLHVRLLLLRRPAGIWPRSSPSSSGPRSEPNPACRSIGRR